MAEKNAGSIDRKDVEDDGIQDPIAYWMEVLDRWVKGIDLDMGRDAAPAAIEGDGGDRV